jgi:uncharacterized membrane protein
MKNFFARFTRLLRHRWMDDVKTRRTFSPALRRTIAQRVAASEQRHSGQVRVCIEGGLPTSYIWRDATARERAIMLFGKLRVWDTAHNNGVLIYLLLAEHAIEIIADRGVDARVSEAEWDALARHMSDAFRAGQCEDGMRQAIDEVTVLLAAHFPRREGEEVDNELPDEPVML